MFTDSESAVNKKVGVVVTPSSESLNAARRTMSNDMSRAPEEPRDPALARLVYDRLEKATRN
jgi:hypothetical protein